MTRNQKLEAMARAWCEFNGWLPDHRPLQMQVREWVDYKPVWIIRELGEPIWKAHVKAMDAILKAIGE